MKVPLKVFSILFKVYWAYCEKETNFGSCVCATASVQQSKIRPEKAAPRAAVKFVWQLKYVLNHLNLG